MLAILSQVHTGAIERGDPQSANEIFDAARAESASLKQTIAKVKNVADQYPYYKYNGIWSRYMESYSFALVLAGWLGWLGEPEGTLLSYQRVAIEMGGMTVESVANYSSHRRRRHEVSSQH
jgi:hypothetical protein